MTREPLDPAQSGFTLLELMVAVVLMAVLALLGWRGLDALIQARQRITQSGDELSAQSLAFAQIEDDLRQAWPVRLIDTGRAVVSLDPGEAQTNRGLRDPSFAPEAALAGTHNTALDLIREAPALSALGAVTASGALTRQLQSSGLQRVVWRVNGGRLERGFVPWSPELAHSGGGTLPMQWQGIIEGIDALGWQVFVPGRGWSGALPAQAPAPMVSGVEVTLVHRGVRLVRVFSVRD